MNTRLAKLDANEYDAIILASAGLIRLGMESRIRMPLPESVSLPAVGQGAVGIECRNDDAELIELLSALNHSETHTRVTAERAMNERLEGGCQVPIGSFATLNDNALTLTGMVGKPDGSTLLFASATGPTENAQSIGVEVAEALLEQGAGDILKALYE